MRKIKLPIQKGYKLYQTYCASCHQEPLFTNGDFANNGLPMDTFLRDHGRMHITQDPADDRKFKVPTLRNLKFSHPYMHDGRFDKLSQVLDHYVKGIEHSETLAYTLEGGIRLTANEKIDLTAFLLTLTDKDFVFNRDYAYPR